LKNKVIIQGSKTWTNPQIENLQKSHELRLIRAQTQHKIQDTYLNFIISSVEKTVDPHGFK